MREGEREECKEIMYEGRREGEKGWKEGWRVRGRNDEMKQ